LTVHSRACAIARPYAARSNRRYHCVPPGGDGLCRWENQRMLSSCHKRFSLCQRCLFCAEYCCRLCDILCFKNSLLTQHFISRCLNSLQRRKLITSRLTPFRHAYGKAHPFIQQQKSVLYKAFNQPNASKMPFPLEASKPY